jgi:hypothetical protein
MELICEKYKKKLIKPGCPHPREYCKFRSSCMVHFLAGERGEENSCQGEEQAGREGTPKPSKNGKG